MKYKHISGYIKDGSLDDSCGRIVIYENKIHVSFIKTSDHNYLLRALASRYRLKKREVIKNALRLYFKYNGDNITISGVRNVDDEMLERDYESYLRLIKKKI